MQITLAIVLVRVIAWLIGYGWRRRRARVGEQCSNQQLRRPLQRAQSRIASSYRARTAVP